MESPSEVALIGMSLFKQGFEDIIDEMPVTGCLTRIADIKSADFDKIEGTIIDLMNLTTNFQEEIK